MTRDSQELIIIGAGSLGVMTLDAALEMKVYKSIKFIDDNKAKKSYIHGHEVIGGMDILNHIAVKEYNFIIAIADNSVRKRISENYTLDYVNIIHPKTSISRFIEIGTGNIILSNTSVDPDVQIHNHVVVNKNNSIGHDSILADHTQVSPGSSLGGFVKLNTGVFIGLGSSIIPHVEVGAWSIIGAGASVTKDISEKCTAVGVPAKVI